MDTSSLLELLQPLIYGVQWLVLVWLAKTIVGVELMEFWRHALQEVKDLAGLRVTPGAINLLCVLVVGIFGIVVIVVTKIHEVLAWLETHLSKEHAEQAHKSTDPALLFFFLGIIFVISILAVIADNKTRKRTK